MNSSTTKINQLFSLRHQYGKNSSLKKLKLLTSIGREPGKSKKALQTWNRTLLFLIAYPDNPSVYQLASRLLQELHLYIRLQNKIKDGLYNSGITNTQLCAAFSFDIVKWMRLTHPKDIRLRSFEAAEGSINSILSVVMPKVESEILQDANAHWRSWLRRSMKKGEDLLDRLIAVFDETDIRPEIRDELWGALGINVEIDLSTQDCLPTTLISPYFHRSLLKKNFKKAYPDLKSDGVELDKTEAEQVIKCGRMILVRHLREIDPITFTAAHLVSYYRLPRGLSIALMGMVPERRHPIDSYMGYVVFKNGLPVAYAGSWILFDSSRIGLNVFPAYRGGESQYIFEQVLKLHREVYQLNRFSVDPYQLGKENSDGIHSGAFWIYYRAGFRPIRQEQRKLAETEAKKIRSIQGYQCPAPILAKLADSRLELLYTKTAARFDATDLSLAYANILDKNYKTNRKMAEQICFMKLTEWLQLKDHHEMKLQFILKNWCVLLFQKEQYNARPALGRNRNNRLKKVLKRIFILKANGSEEDYITELQRAKELRRFLERMLLENVG